MRKKFFRGFFILFLFLLAGCGGRSSLLINLAGSTSVQPLAELLAESYMKKNPAVTIDVQGGGSSAGIEAVLQEVVDIGTSSRPLKDNEKNLIPYEIAFDAVAVIVNPQNALKGLKLPQLKKIYSGQIKEWCQVFPGGARREIDLVTREEGSGTRDAFTKIVMAELDITPLAIVEDATGVVREVVASDPAAIGYISLGIADKRVKVLEIEGVKPTLETVRTRRYKITRPFLFVLKKKPAGEVKKFLDFVLGPAGQKIVREAGFVPVI
jgi:phosphate transport system substrate-binding protein